MARKLLFEGKRVTSGILDPKLKPPVSRSHIYTLVRIIRADNKEVEVEVVKKNYRLVCTIEYKDGG